MRRTLSRVALAFALVLSSTSSVQAWEVTPPSWAGEINTPTTFQWGNWLPCLPEYRDFDCIDSVFWVKESGEKIPGKWVPAEGFDYSTFQTKYRDHPDGYSAQFLEKSIFWVGNYEFDGLVTPCSIKPNAISIDVRAARYSFQLNATGPAVSQECAWFTKKFEERFEVTLKSNNLKGLIGGVSSNGRSPAISFSERGGFGRLTLSARFAYMPWNNGDSEFENLDVCKKNLERARQGGWALWNSIFFVNRTSGSDELLKENPGDMITGTNGWNCGGNLRWDPTEGALVMQVGAPHYDVDGSVVEGWFEGQIRGRYIKSRFGVEPAQAAGNARLEVVYTDGEVKVATIAAKYDVTSDSLTFNAYGFTYSAPVLKLTFKSESNESTKTSATRQEVAKPSTTKKSKRSITCIKSGKSERFTGSKCPKGFKRA